MALPKHTAVGVDGNADLPVDGANAAFIAADDKVDCPVPEDWAVVGFMYDADPDKPGKPPAIRFELVRNKFLYVRGC